MANDWSILAFNLIKRKHGSAAHYLNGREGSQLKSRLNLLCTWKGHNSVFSKIRLSADKVRIERLNVHNQPYFAEINKFNNNKSSN